MLRIAVCVGLLTTAFGCSEQSRSGSASDRSNHKQAAVVIPKSLIADVAKAANISSEMALNRLTEDALLAAEAERTGLANRGDIVRRTRAIRARVAVRASDAGISNLLADARNRTKPQIESSAPSGLETAYRAALSEDAP